MVFLLSFAGVAVLRGTFMFALPKSAIEQTCSKHENVTLNVYNRGEIKNATTKIG